MLIIVDSREQCPYAFEDYECECKTQTLHCGDYSPAGFEDRVAIERKSLDDLVGCLMGCNRERFERELYKFRFYDLAVVVVEAAFDDVSKGRFRSGIKPHAAMQSIFAFQVRYRVPFLWCGNRAGAEYVCYSLLSKYLYEIEKRYQKALKSHGNGV